MGNRRKRKHVPQPPAVAEPPKRDTREWVSKLVFFVLGLLATAVGTLLAERRERQQVAGFLLVEVELNERVLNACLVKASQEGTTTGHCVEDRTVFNATLLRQSVLPVDVLRTLRNTYEEYRVLSAEYAGVDKQVLKTQMKTADDDVVVLHGPTKLIVDSLLRPVRKRLAQSQALEARERVQWSQLAEKLRFESRTRWWLNWF